MKLGSSKLINSKSIIASNKTHRKFILNTQYGKLAILRPIICKSLRRSDSNIINSIINIDNNSSSNYTKMILKTKTDYLLFIPNINFGNCHQIFQSTKEKIIELHYGSVKKPKNPFVNCKNPSEIFHLSQNIKISIAAMLNRIGFMLFKTGEVNIIHRENSILSNNLSIQSIFKQIIRNYESEFQEEDNQQIADKFSKYDYFLSCSFYEGIISSNNYINKGIEVAELGNKKIYPQYGVFNITRTDYIRLFNRYLKECLTDFNFEKSNAIDLGCGTGILSFLLCQRGMKRVFAVDNLENAVISCQSNAQALGFHDKIKPVFLDIVENYGIGNIESLEYSENGSIVKVNKGIKQIIKQKNHDDLLEKLKLDNMFDFIVVNPPWLNTNFIFNQLDYENSVCDPKHRFLISCFNFAKIHLNRLNSKAKFVVIFSDLGNLLNLNEFDCIEKLANRFNFKITNQIKEQSKYNPKNIMDPLKNFKKESKLFIYEMQRV